MSLESFKQLEGIEPKLNFLKEVVTGEELIGGIEGLPIAVSTLVQQINESSSLNPKEKVATTMTVFYQGAVIAAHEFSKPTREDLKDLSLGLYRFYTEEANKLSVAKSNFS